MNDHDRSHQRFVRRATYLLITWLAIIAFAAFGDWRWLLLAPSLIGLHLIFRDTLNTFQWFPFWRPTSRMRRLYWMTRTNVSTATRNIERSSIYLMDDGGDPHTGEGFVPPFTGSGVKVRFGHVSVEVGFGRVRQSSVFHRELDADVETIKREFYNLYRGMTYEDALESQETSSSD